MPEQSAPRPGVVYVEIGSDRDGQRLDNFLIGHLKGVPKSRIYRIIRDGQVRVNRKRAKQGQRLQTGDQVRIPPVRTADRPVAPAVGDALAERLSRALLYEDSKLLVYNKPAGLAVHGGSGIQLGLIETLRALRPQETGLELVHRLDRDTSGCIMVARQRPFLRKLQKAMQQGDMVKTYWLLCDGFRGGSRDIDAPLLKTMQGSERVVRVSRDGKPSLTRFRLLRRLRHGQLVEATLETGRTHQIRVHAQHGGFPLMGDPKYGNPRVNDELRKAGLGRMFLHAHSLSLVHPDTGKKLHIEAPLDAPFEQALAWLDREDSDG